MAEIGSIYVGMDEFERDIVPDGPFGKPVKYSELKEEIIENVVTNIHRIQPDEEPQEEIKGLDIRTDEINARKAFMYFNDQQLQRDGQETFKDRVLRLKSELSNMHKFIKTNEISSKEENKEGDKSNKILAQVEDLLARAEHLVAPVGEEKVSRGLADILSGLKIESKEGQNENVVYELMFNKDCKNLMIAAKISELKKRIRIIHK
jgi:hypothetical protein